MTIETLDNPAAIVAVKGESDGEARKYSRLAELAPAGFDAVSLSPVNGPALYFHGQLLMSVQSKAKDQRYTEWNLWKTVGGKYIAETAACSGHDYDVEFSTVTVIPAMPEPALKMAVMNAFEWRNHPRRALKDALGWDFPAQWVA